jgi:hypothetical protein
LLLPIEYNGLMDELRQGYSRAAGESEVKGTGGMHAMKKGHEGASKAQRGFQQF